MNTRIEINCGNGITLETLKTADAETVAQLANNRALWLNLRDRMPQPYTFADAVWFIETALKGDFGLTFGVYLDGKFAGVAGIVMQSDIHRLSGEIGYWLGEPYWGRGIATDAIRHLIHYAFANTELIRLFAGIFAYNKPSMRVLEKNGFVLDAVLKAAIYKDGKVVDEYLYSLVDEEKVAALSA